MQYRNIFRVLWFSCLKCCLVGVCCCFVQSVLFVCFLITPLLLFSCWVGLLLFLCYGDASDAGKYACKEHNAMMELMEKYCGYSVNNIPQVADISAFMKGKRIGVSRSVILGRSFVFVVSEVVVRCAPPSPSPK